MAIVIGRGLVFLFVLLGARCSGRTSEAGAGARAPSPTVDTTESVAREREAQEAACEATRQTCLAERPDAHTEARYAKWQGCELDYATCAAAALRGSAP